MFIFVNYSSSKYTCLQINRFVCYYEQFYMYEGSSGINFRGENKPEKNWKTFQFISSSVLYVTMFANTNENRVTYFLFMKFIRQVFLVWHINMLVPTLHLFQSVLGLCFGLFLGSFLFPLLMQLLISLQSFWLSLSFYTFFKN